jgi:hypothetical protein
MLPLEEILMAELLNGSRQTAATLSEFCRRTTAWTGARLRSARYFAKRPRPFAKTLSFGIWRRSVTSSGLPVGAKVAAPDGGRITAFQVFQCHQRPPWVSLCVSPVETRRWRDIRSLTATTSAASVARRDVPLLITSLAPRLLRSVVAARWGFYHTSRRGRALGCRQQHGLSGSPPAAR